MYNANILEVLSFLTPKYETSLLERRWGKERLINQLHEAMSFLRSLQ
jgi:hypothetical protein